MHLTGANLGEEPGFKCLCNSWKILALNFVPGIILKIEMKFWWMLYFYIRLVFQISIWCNPKILLKELWNYMFSCKSTDPENTNNTAFGADTNFSGHYLPVSTLYEFSESAPVSPLLKKDWCCLQQYQTKYAACSSQKKSHNLYLKSVLWIHVKFEPENLNWFQTERLWLIAEVFGVI